MKCVVIGIFLFLSACASAPKQDLVSSIGVYAKPEEIRASYGDYGRIALAMNMYEPFIGAIREKFASDKEVSGDPEKMRFMANLFKRFDEKSFTGQLVNVLKKHYSASEAREISSFFETPQGREGMRLAVSMYQASQGKQQQPVMSADVEAAWEQFAKKPAGRKFLGELPKVSEEFTIAINNWGKGLMAEAAAEALTKGSGETRKTSTKK